MKFILLIAVALIAFALAHNVQADSTLPNYPPASQLQANVTFQPGLYENDKQKFTGVFHFNSDSQKYSLLAHDAIRTTEISIFLEDSHTQYVMSEFGEFGFDCIKYTNDGLTGFAGAFIPPFGFDMSSATYSGVAACAAGNCDAFEIKSASGVSATLLFEEGTSADRKLVGVETVDAQHNKRSAQFSNWQVTTQDDSYFKLPTKAKCHAP